MPRGLPVLIAISMVLWGMPSLCSVAKASPGRSVSYHGFAIAVDEVTGVAPGYLKITLGKDSFVVSESDAPTQLVKRVLAGETKPSSEAIHSLMERAVRAADESTLALLISAGLTKPNYVEFDSLEVWQKLTDPVLATVNITRMVRDVSHEALASRACACLTALKGFRGALEELFIRFADDCLTFTVNDALSKVQDKQSLVTAIEQIQAAREIFGGQAGAKGTRSQEVLTTLERLSTAIDIGDEESFTAAVSSLDALATEYKAARVVSSEVGLVESFIEDALRRKQFDSVMRYLPKLNLTHRSPLIHGAVVRSLESMTSDQVVDVMSPARWSALGLFADKDDEIAAKVTAVVKHVVRGLTAQGRTEQAYFFLAGIPSEPELFVSVIRENAPRVIDGFLREGAFGQAREASLKLPSHVGPLLAFRLWLARWDLALWRVVLAILALCGLLGYVGYRARRQRQQGASDSARPIGEMPAGDGSESLQGIDARVVYSQELTESLRQFGLQPGATMREIKSAYRVAVKRCHPDRSGGARSGDNQAFIRLTKEYERLLELYERDVGA